MRFETQVFELAAKRYNWTMRRLAEESGVPLSTLYALKSGERNPGAKTIAKLMGAFPEASFERLFVPTDSRKQEDNSSIEKAAA